MDTSDKDVISALSAVLSNSGSWYTSRKSNTSSTSSERHKKTSSKNKMLKENEEHESLTDDNDEKSNESDDVFLKRKKSYEKDGENTIRTQESENDDDFDEPAFKIPRFSFTNIPEDTADGHSSPIIEVDPRLLEHGSDLEIDHIETPMQAVISDPLIFAADPGVFKDLTYKENVDADLFI